MKTKFISFTAGVALTVLCSFGNAQNTLFLGKTSILQADSSDGLSLEAKLEKHKNLSDLIMQPSKEYEKTVRELVSDKVQLQIQAVQGGWTGNGGDGFACFESEEIAKKAIDTNGVLVDNYRPLIKLVFPRDLPETPYAWPAVMREETVLAYVKRILNESDLNKFPYAEAQIKSLLKSFLNADGSLRWNSVQGLVPIQDQGKSTVRDNVRLERHNCRVVQLVHRYQKLNPNQTVELFFDADFDLLYRMLNPQAARGHLPPRPGDGERAVAVLLLHEIAYTISSLAGDQDSESARKFIATYFTRLPNQKNVHSFDFTSKLHRFDSFYSSLNVSTNKTAFLNSSKTWLELRQQIYQKTQRVRDTYLNHQYSIYVEFFLRGDELKAYQKNVYDRLLPEERWLYLADFLYRAESLSFSPDAFLLEENNEKLDDMKTTVCDGLRRYGLKDNSVLALCRQ